MGVLVWNWDEAQSFSFSLLTRASNIFVYSLITSAVQFVVAKWIWTSRAKAADDLNQHILSSAHIITGILNMWIIYSVHWTMSNTLLFGGSILGYRIGLTVMVIEGVLMNLLVFAYLPVKSSKKDDDISGDLEGAETNNVVAHASSIATGEIVSNDQPKPESEPPKKKNKPVVHYINNIKIFLTHMVILHHCACTVMGLPGSTGVSFAVFLASMSTLDSIPYLFMDTNSSYFMACFFFYSGYFAPRSFDKKGVFICLFERVKRLGIPFVIYTYVLGPYVARSISGSLLTDGDSVIGTPFPENTWFLAQLLVINILYALLCGKGWSPKVPFPGIPKLLLFGFGLGIITGIITLFVLSNFFFSVPMFFEQYLYYVVFFFGGALANRNNWMEELQKQISGKTRVVLYCSFIIFPGLMLIRDILVPPDDTLPTGVRIVVNILYTAIVKGGLSTMYWNIVITDIFMKFMNKKYWCTDFFSKSMYTAYIIQYVFPMQIGFYLWVQILRSKGEDIVFTATERVAFISSSGLAIPGFLFVSFVTTLICWPSAYLIYSIPGFNKVL